MLIVAEDRFELSTYGNEPYEIPFLHSAMRGEARFPIWFRPKSDYVRRIELPCCNYTASYTQVLCQCCG